MKILIVDDEQVALTSVRRLLKRRGFEDVEITDSGDAAINLIRNNDFDIVLLDLLMPKTDGLKVLEAAKPFKANTEFIMLTAVDDSGTAVKALRLGAYDYLVKPIDTDRLFVAIEHAFERIGLRSGLAGAASERKRAAVPPAFAAIITRSPRMKELLLYANTMARSGAPVLITGETGTGKELMAKAIHQAGPNPKGPFIAANVTSIPENLFEDQFFGHVQGAFTGASKDHPGFFEQADHGTLFLDEIGDLPQHLQVKLLRVLEEKKIIRLGDTQAMPVNVRIISATNKDLDKACQEERFRLDLIYRLKTAHIHLPPLSERQDDIPLLAEYFLTRACERHGKRITGFSTEAMEELVRCQYPGNIRELAQRVETAVLLADADTLLPAHLGAGAAAPLSFARTLCTLKEDTERHLAYVLQHTKGNRGQAAAILGITVRQVQRRIADMARNPRWQSFLNDL